MDLFPVFSEDTNQSLNPNKGFKNFFKSAQTNLLQEPNLLPKVRI